MVYTQEMLKKVQALEKMMLKDFHNICQKYEIPYSIMWGSAIGVLRHKDIIPWDDDIDIALMRDDMMRLIDIIKKEYSDKYFVLNYFENENYPLMTTHIVLKDTRFVVCEFEGLDCPFGIYLDIFPIDYISEDEKKAKRQFKRAWFYNKLFILRSMGTPKVSVPGWKGNMVRFACKVIHGLFKVLHISKKSIYNAYLKEVQRYKDTTMVSMFESTMPRTKGYRYSDIFPVEEKEFADFKVMLSKNIDNILRDEYGDYMQLPPVEARQNHNPVIVEFGKYE